VPRAAGAIRAALQLSRHRDARARARRCRAGGPRARGGQDPRAAARHPLRREGPGRGARLPDDLGGGAVSLADVRPGRDSGDATGRRGRGARGKLAMVELAGGMGYSQANASFTGPGKTPWNVDYWSGGSSSGPGAAVAARLVPFAIGSETSGSILTPAAYCGITGLRPTYGLVSRHGAIALSWTMDKLGP